MRERTPWAWPTLDLDLASKLLMVCSSLHCILTSDLSTQETRFKNVLFVRNVWVPQLFVSLFLLLTSLISSACASLRHRNIVLADSFLVITLEKLITIGYNLHLIIFHSSLLYTTESALLLLPLLVFALSTLDSALAILYLDTVFFDIHEWQERLTQHCHIHLLSFLLPHHLLCLFLFRQYDTISIQFTHSSYALMED